MSWTLIEDDAALAELLRRYADAQAVMVDTEFMRQDTFYPRAALIQLCFGDREAWLIDPLQITDFAPLCELFSNPSVMKVLHSASEDLEVFQRLLGVLPRPLFDTQRAAALLNRGHGLGYRALVEAICGLELGKGETRSDWLRRPLSENQLHYAAQDVIHLLAVYRDLDIALQSAGKLEWLLEEGDLAVEALLQAPAPAYLRVKSAWKLPPEKLAVLAVICDWRETRARESDKPRNWILQDKVCLAIAQQLPRNKHELSRIEGLPGGVLRRQGERLLELVQQGLAMDASQLPAALPRPLGRADQDRLKSLKAKGREVAQALDVAPELLLAGKDYELLLRIGQGEQLQQPGRWQGWRRERVIEPLLGELGAIN